MPRSYCENVYNFRLTKTRAYIECTSIILVIIDVDVYDWGTCDNLSCHVLKEVLLSNSECIEVTTRFLSHSRWFDHGRMPLPGDSARLVFRCFILRDTISWQMWLWTFVIRICLEEWSCRAIKNQYRFTQLGVGWVLRDVSVFHPELVVDFINEHEQYFTKEAVRYALEKMTPTHRDMVYMVSKK